MAKIFYITYENGKHQLYEQEVNSKNRADVYDQLENKETVVGAWDREKYAKAWLRYYNQEITVDELNRVLSS